MPTLGNRLTATLSPMVATVVSAGPRLLFAFLAALVIASIARAKVNRLTDVDGDGKPEDGAELAATLTTGSTETLLLASSLTTNASMPTFRSQQATATSYGQNLHRVYDGKWNSLEYANLFSYVPTWTKSTPAVMFEETTGYVYLDAENHALPDLGSDFQYVFGSILLRDGSYRTVRDVELQVMGLYEDKTGIFSLVGDYFYDNTVLHRLYEQVKRTEWDMNETQFLSIMQPLIEKEKKEVQGYDKESLHSTFKRSARQNPDSISQKGQMSVRGSNENDYLMRSSGENDYLMSGRLVSEACRTTVNIGLSILDTEKPFVKAINYTLLVTFVAFTQVLVLIRQMEMTSTQAGANRVSLLTVGLQTISDSYLCLAHLTIGIALQTLFNAFATAAFFKFIIFSIFEMRYMLMIWKARRMSAFSGGWDSMRRELSILYSRFYGSLLLGIIILYYLQNHIRIFIFVLFSFWVPQVVLNVVADHRRPLYPLYIIGMSATRLAIPMYFWCCPRNFLKIKPQPVAGMMLMLWVTFQACVLLLQHRLGARWFVPKKFLPEKYDYYRRISICGSNDDDLFVDVEIDEPDAAPTKLKVSGVGEPSGLHPRGGQPIVEVDCVICMSNVVVNGRNRMATPCDHVFHEECLQEWMDVKMECPTCRRILPPL